MATKITGTNTAAAPGVTGDDTDTGLFYGTNEIGFSTGGTSRATIDSSGRLLLGTTTAGFAAYGDALTIEDSNHVGLTLRTATNKDSAIYFADSSSGGGRYAGGINYNHSNNYLNFTTNESERLRIDSSGNVYIGCTAELSNYESDKTKLSIFDSGTSGAYLELGGDQTADDYSAGTILFCNANNSSSVRHVAMQRAEIVTSDNNAGDDSGADLVFYTRPEGGNPQANFRINSDRNVHVVDGNLVIGTSGHGIDFSANSHAGGMTSETLDSYEEGTWTATAANSVTLHSNANGCGYTKIGRLVTVTGQIRVNSDNSNDSFYINNLPFTSADTDDQSSFSAGGCRIWSWDINVADHVDIVCSVSENSSALEFWVNRDGQSAIALPASAGSYIAFSLTYPAA